MPAKRRDGSESKSRGDDAAGFVGRGGGCASCACSYCVGGSGVGDGGGAAGAGASRRAAAGPPPKKALRRRLPS